MPNNEKRSVLQDWVHGLSFMQQSVLMAAVRGPDGIAKDHTAKVLLRWYRRCILLSAFDNCAVMNPVHRGGGSFTGPSIPFEYHSTYPKGLEPEDVMDHLWAEQMYRKVKEYLACVDELPHHFQLHFMHAAEILGYLHPQHDIRMFWETVYLMIVNDAHLVPESRERMMKRLGDSEQDWRAAEVVTAKQPQ
jgi:hypothetical protein